MTVLLGFFFSHQQMYLQRHDDPQFQYQHPIGPLPRHPPANYTVPQPRQNIPLRQYPQHPQQCLPQQPQYTPLRQCLVAPQHAPALQPHYVPQPHYPAPLLESFTPPTNYYAPSTQYYSHQPQFLPPAQSNLQPEQHAPLPHHFYIPPVQRAAPLPQFEPPQPYSFGPQQQHYAPQQSYHHSQQQCDPPPQPAYPQQSQFHHNLPHVGPGYVPPQTPPLHDIVQPPLAQYAPICQTDCGLQSQGGPPTSFPQPQISQQISGTPTVSDEYAYHPPQRRSPNGLAVPLSSAAEHESIIPQTFSLDMTSHDKIATEVPRGEIGSSSPVLPPHIAPAQIRAGNKPITTFEASRRSTPKESSEDSSLSETDVCRPSVSDVSLGSLLHKDQIPLKVLHWEGWMGARSRAKKVAHAKPGSTGKAVTLPHPCDEYFEAVPWEASHWPEMQHHVYPDNKDGSRNSGLLWVTRYLCSKSNHLGLCWYTFGTPGNCPLGASCRWNHSLSWTTLLFLITSGRVSVQLARQLMANWNTNEHSDLLPEVIARMKAITLGLGERLEPKILPSRRASSRSWDDIC